MKPAETNGGLVTVAAIVSTRNRGDSITATIKSLLANDYPDFEIIVVDQSDNDATKTALQEFLSDKRLRYYQSATKGLSIGRNIAIRQTQAEILAITDDDCEVPNNWLREMVAAFEQNPKIGVVFGNVLETEHDRSQGFVPNWYQEGAHFVYNHKQKDLITYLGMGACMGLRRSVWEKTHGFDNLLGAGAPITGWEDQDIAYKALRAGYYVYQTSKVVLRHYGFRTLEQGRQLAYRNWYGIGGALVKHVRLGNWSIVPLMLKMFLFVAVKDFLVNSFQQRRVRNAMPIAAFFAGLYGGFKYKLNRATGNYASNVDYATAIIQPDAKVALPSKN